MITNPHGPKMAAARKPLLCPLHANQRVPDEHGGGVVLGCDHQELNRSAHRNAEELAAAINALGGSLVLPAQPKPFVWHKTAEQILGCPAGDCATINSGKISASVRRHTSRSFR